MIDLALKESATSDDNQKIKALEAQVKLQAMLIETLEAQVDLSSQKPLHYQAFDANLVERNQRTRELSSLIDIIRSTSSKLDINEVLTITAQHFTQALNVTACNVMKWSPGREMFFRWGEWWAGKPDGNPYIKRAVPLSERPSLKMVLDTRQFTIKRADDPDLEPQDLALMRQYQATALLIFPFATNEGIVGVIEIYDSQPHRAFTEAEIHYCQTIGDHLGVIFERTQLHSEIQRRAEQLELLNQLSAQISGLVRIRDLCDFVAGNLCEQFGYHSVSIFRVDEESGGIVLESVAGASSHFLTPGDVVVMGEGIVGTAVQKAEVIQVEVVDRIPETQSLKIHGILAELALPLVLHDRVIGVLVVDEAEGDALPNTHVTLLMTLADQLALALDKARLFEENQLRNFELESIIKENQALEAISQALNESLDLKEVFKLIEEAVNQIIPHVTQVAVHILEKEQNKLVPIRGEDISLEMPLGEGIAGLAGQHKKLLNVPDVQKHPRFIASSNPNIYALLVAPILRKGELVGTISISSNKNAAFSVRDETLISRLATITALAIQNAQIYQDEQEERQFAEALLSATMVLNSSLNLNDILDHILEQINLVVPNRSANIMLVRGDSAFIARHIEAGLNIEASEAIRISLDWPTINMMKTNKKPVFIPDTQVFPDWQVIEGREWVRTFIGVPMFFQDELIGFLNVVSDKPYFFSEKAPRRLEALAASAALALRNAQLLSDLAGSLAKEQQTRAQLVQADKLTALGRMVASIAHEINNPIQTIKNTFYLALDEVEPASQVAHFIEIAMSETNRIANLIAQLRDTYRPRANATAQHVDLTQLLRDIKVLITPHLEQHHILWQAPKETRTIIVPGFPDRLKQVFINLSLNAIEAMHRESQDGTLTVNIQVDAKARRVGVRFRDTGPGVPPEILKNMFEPFFTTKETGTGLGLAISYDIVQQHQGHISVDSAIGQGTTFLVWLPYLAIH